MPFRLCKRLFVFPSRCVAHKGFVLPWKPLPWTHESECSLLLCEYRISKTMSLPSLEKLFAKEIISPNGGAVLALHEADKLSFLPYQPQLSFHYSLKLKKK